MWAQLVRAMDDNRYCLTVAYHPPAEAGYAEANYSVGYFCREIAVRQLHHVYEQHLPRVETRPIQLTLEPNIRRVLAAWGRNPTGKSLVEWQIDLCTAVLADLPNVKRKHLDDDSPTKAQAMERIEAQIKELKKTGRPVIPRTDPLYPFMLFDRDTAEMCRQ